MFAFILPTNMELMDFYYFIDWSKESYLISDKQFITAL